MDDFPDPKVCIEAPGISDHCPIVVNVFLEVFRRRPFKLFNFWMQHKKFKEVLKTSW